MILYFTSMEDSTLLYPIIRQISYLLSTGVSASLHSPKYFFYKLTLRIELCRRNIKAYIQIYTYIYIQRIYRFVWKTLLSTVHYLQEITWWTLLLWSPPHITHDWFPGLFGSRSRKHWKLLLPNTIRIRLSLPWH